MGAKGQWRSSWREEAEHRTANRAPGGAESVKVVYEVCAILAVG